jgi:hypothetical protein
VREISEEENEVEFRKQNSKLFEEALSQKCYNRDEFEVTYCLSVDGSQHCSFAFDILVRDLFTKASSVLMIYIYHSNLNKEFNYQNRKETVIDIYETRALRFNSKTCFLNEDTNSSHYIEQVYTSARSHKADFLITGWVGLTGPKRDKKVQHNAIDYLMKEVKLPCIVVRSKSNRILEKGFNWLFIVENLNQNSLKILSTFLPLVKENDFIKFINLIPIELKKDVFREIIEKETSYYSLKKIEYELTPVIKQEDNIKEIIESVNFGKIDYDFVVFHHNSERLIYNPDITKHQTYKLLYDLRSNICFYA